MEEHLGGLRHLLLIHPEQMWWSLSDWSPRGDSKTQQCCSCAPQQHCSAMLSLYWPIILSTNCSAPLYLLHLLSCSISSPDSNSCSPHSYQDQSSGRNFVIPPHSLNSLLSHSSGLSPRRAGIIHCSKAMSMVWPEKGQTTYSPFN